MSKYVILLVILISFEPLRAAELVKVNDEESKDFQESAFIKLMAKFNGGKIPYPFENLLDSFGTGEKEQGDVLFVPKGRSLVKESADYHNPRIIIAPFTNFPNSNFGAEETEEVKKWNAKKKLIQEELGIEKGDLFIGFAPNHKALEIISYNPNKPGYDFFIVEDYEEEKIPKIIHNPSLCLSCHQNKGPIFPRVGWNEILGETANQPFTDQSFKENEMMDRVKAANLERKKIEGILLDKPEHFNRTRVAVFDSDVRAGNSQLTSNEFCNALCDKKDFKCQRALIEETLNKSFKYSSYPYFNDKLKKLSDIKIASSVIPNRDPYTNKAFRVFVSEASIERMNQEGNLSNTIDSVAISLGLTGPGLLQEMKKNKNGYEVTNHVVITAEEQILMDDPAAINPATIRPLEADLNNLLNKIKKETKFNEKIKIAAEMCVFMPVPPDEIKQKQLPKNLFDQPAIKEALKLWPEARKLNFEILKLLQNDPKSPIADKECNPTATLPILEVYQYSAVEKVIDKFNEEKIKKPEALFGKYCIQCHGGPTPFIPLPLNSAKAMAEYKPRFGTTNVLERLEKKIMPPAGAPQPNSEERAKLVKLMKELSK